LGCPDRTIRLRKTLLILGLAPSVLMIVGLAVWRFWPAPPPPETLTFDIGGQRLRFASAYVRMPETIEPDRVDLVVRAPDFAPAAATPARLPAAGEVDDKGRTQIFLTLTPAAKLDRNAPPAERYAPFLASEAQVTEGGLLRRRFEDNSPYAGEDLYLAPPDGEDFFARCQRPRIPSDGLPDACLSDFRVDGVMVQMRFDPVWLAEWQHLRGNALQLTRAAMAP
jgi:hypothetical protein